MKIVPPQTVIYFMIFRLVFGIFFILNLVLWVEGSSAAIPFTTLLALLALWFGISVPLTFVGAYFGFKKRVSTINSTISNSVLYFRMWFKFNTVC